MKFHSILFTLLCSLTSLASAQSPPPPFNGVGSLPRDRFAITATQALAVLNAARSKAQVTVPENIAIVDNSGTLVSFLHMDNALPGSIDIAMKKAKTVVLFNGAPSGSLNQMVQPGGSTYGLEETNGGLIVFQGGLPIYDDKMHLLGAIGVSGGSGDQDVQVAQAGIAALPPA